MTTLLTDQVAIVTGATGSIGRHIVSGLLEQGATVIAGYHQHKTLMDSLAATWGPRCMPLAADLRTSEGAQALADLAMTTAGNIDILVTAHSFVNNAPIETMTLAQWNEVLDIMLTGTTRICRTVLRPMQRARYGRIVTISGYQPLAGALTQANYAAALGGIIGFSKALAREVAAWGITVNNVAPGLIERPQLAGFDQSYLPWATNIIPQKRIGQPQEIAPAVLMLAAPTASYITGQTICIDGGWRMV